METVVATFFPFLTTARDRAPHSTSWAFGTDFDDCRVRNESFDIFVAVPFEIHQTVDQIDVLELLHQPRFDEVVGYVVYRRTEKTNWGTENSIGWIPYVWYTVMLNNIPFFNRGPSERDGGGFGHLLRMCGSSGFIPWSGENGQSGTGSTSTRSS